MDETTCLLKAIQDGEQQHHKLAVHLSTRNQTFVTMTNGAIVSVLQLCYEAIRLARHQREHQSAFFALGYCLPEPDVLQLHDGRMMNKREAYIQAIVLSGYTSSGSFNNLGNLLRKGELITLPNTCVVDSKELFKRAIECDSRLGIAYFNLANQLAKDETFILHGGEGTNAKQLYIKAIQLTQSLHSFFLHYINLAKLMDKDETVTLYDATQYDRKMLCVQALRQSSKSRYAQEQLLDIFENVTETVTMPDGQTMNILQICVSFLAKNPDDYYAFFKLGRFLKNGMTVMLQNGVVLDSRASYLQAHRCNPRSSIVYKNLGMQLKNGETIVLTDGRTLDKRGLFVEAIRCDGNSKYAWVKLGEELQTNDVVFLPDGRMFDNKQCLLKAIQLDPGYYAAYSHLVRALRPFETVQLPDGRVLNGKQILIEWCEKGEDSAFGALALLMQDDETVTLNNGQPHTVQIMNSKQLNIECIRRGKTWILDNLAFLMEAHETIVLADGSSVTQRHLFLEALRCNKTAFDDIYIGLGMTMADDETIEMPPTARGCVWNNRHLLIEAVHLCEAENKSRGMIALAVILKPDEQVTLRNGRVMNSVQLLTESFQGNKNFDSIFLPWYPSTKASAATDERSAYLRAFLDNRLHNFAVTALNTRICIA